MSIFEAIVLGIVQGLTEFLPVSSSGHIELGTALLHIQSKDNLLFSVVVHFATALSTIVVFRKDIAEIVSGIFKLEKDALDFTGKIFLSMLPVGLIGVFFKEEVESFFGGNIMLVGFMLLITALLLAMTYYSRKKGGPVTYGKALLIGVAQALAIMPGISRSGATIATGLLVGVEKGNAARFSFLMVLIPILGASLLEIKDYIEQPAAQNSLSGMVLLLGFLSAFISGLLACQWMIDIVKRGKLIYFALYCFIIGTIAIITALL